MSEYVIVTRHNALVQLLQQLGLIKENVKIIQHVHDPKEIENKIVIGTLPLSLASKAREIWSVDLVLRPEDRGRELTLEELKERFKGIRRYRVEDLGEVK